MALTANDFAAQMVAQARILDPSFSGEIGTPERKLIDTVAQTLADNQIDLTGLQGALDMDSKFGANLDRFTALFGFQRQQAIAATGFVAFSRPTPATTQIIIPTGTVVQATIAGVNTNSHIPGPGFVQFRTTASGTITIGSTTSNLVPIQAAITGGVGNVAANTILQITSTPPPPGVTQVSNPDALTNGQDVEDDNSYKVRFKNTWARNLAGTESQYLALALASGTSTKAVVVGAQSRFQEYIQVPSFDDAGFLATVQTATQNTEGVQNQWTSAQSTLPFAKQIYTTTQTYITNGQQGPAQYFYNPGSDFQFNYPALLTGDTLRNTAYTTLSGNVTFPASTINVASTGRPTSGLVTQAFPPAGQINVGGQIVTYTGVTVSSFTGCTGGTGTITSGSPVWAIPTSTAPNFTFLNVYNPVSSPIDGLQALSPQNVVLAEYSYISSASRNDMAHGVTNAVDVYVNGSNPLQTSAVMLPNVLTQTFNTNPSSPWYYENYRRDGQPTKRPQLNNYLTPLFQPVITGLPSSIVLNSVTFNLNTDYWLVHENDSLGGSSRARDGIEWNRNSSPTNNIATASAPGANIPLDVTNYLYDANIPTLQAAMEANAQIGTDVLVHAGRTRYFKLDIAVMYSPNSNYAAVNSAIQSTVQQYFDNQYFGSVIQLSDLLEIIHETQGVDNVRWSNDLPTIPDLIRVYEADASGNPVHGASIDRWQVGTGSQMELQTLYVVGSPFGIGSVIPTTVNATYTTPAATITLANTTGIVPGMTIQVGGSTTDVSTVASVAGAVVTLNAPLTNSHVSTDPVMVAQCDTFTLTWPGFTSKPIPLVNPDGSGIGSPVGANAIQKAIHATATGGTTYTGIGISLDTRPSFSVSKPIYSFTVTYGANGAVAAPTVTNNITASSYGFDSDFFLFDNELPSLPSGQVAGDTLPGLIIRPRAQSTFNRPGLF